MGDEYKMKNVIGKGPCTMVTRAENRTTRQNVAVKIIPKKKLSCTKLQVVDQLEQLEALDHPNIVRMQAINENEENYGLVFELMSGQSMVDLLDKKGMPIPEKDAHNLIVPIFDAVLYSHSVGITHRDIKLENLLVTEGQTVKISDFGMMDLIDKNLHSLGSTYHVQRASPAFIAPEELNKDQYEDENDGKCDLWSLGCILFYILCGVPPFYDEDHFLLFDKIKEGDYNFDHPNWEQVSPEGQDFISQLLVTDPSKRLGAEGVIEHPWYEG